MEIIGKIFKVGENIAGTSENGSTWVRKTVVVEQLSTHPMKLAFTAAGENRCGDIDDLKLKTDDVVRVIFEPRSREYEGKWFSELSVIRLEKLDVKNE